MLDLRRMRALREVASRGSVSAAAEALDYTQPAISQQIAALEREVGTRLLERGTRPARLTDAGRALVAHTEAVLARLDDAEQELDEIKGLRAGRLRLASFSTALASVVPRALVVFTERHPDVRVSVVEDNLKGVIGRLGRWELDLGLIYEHEALPEPKVELERVHLFDEPFELLLPHRHRFSGRRSLRADIGRRNRARGRPHLGDLDGEVQRLVGQRVVGVDHGVVALHRGHGVRLLASGSPDHRRTDRHNCHRRWLRRLWL